VRKLGNSTLIIIGIWPSSRTNSTGSPPFIEYSKVAESLPLYETCLSLHSAGKISLLRANLFEGGTWGFCRVTSLTRMLSVFFPSGPVLSSPSRNVLVPISARPCASSPGLPSSRKMPLKDSMWGLTASCSAGYALRSFGGLRKRSWRRRVLNPWSHSVFVAEGAMAVKTRPPRPADGCREAASLAPLSQSQVEPHVNRRRSISN